MEARARKYRLSDVERQEFENNVKEKIWIPAWEQYAGGSHRDVGEEEDDGKSS